MMMLDIGYAVMVVVVVVVIADGNHCGGWRCWVVAMVVVDSVGV